LGVRVRVNVWIRVTAGVLLKDRRELEKEGSEDKGTKGNGGGGVSEEEEEGSSEGERSKKGNLLCASFENVLNEGVLPRVVLNDPHALKHRVGEWLRGELGLEEGRTERGVGLGLSYKG